MESKRSRRFAALTVRLGTFLAALLLGLVGAEGIVRLVAPQAPTWLNIYTAHTTIPTYTLQPNVRQFLDTGEVAWSVFTDSDGFRCGSGARRDPAAPALLMLGDSYTFGLGVDHEQTFCGRIESQVPGNLRVLNAGVNGYGPSQYRGVLEHFLQQGERPAMVILTTYTGNDFYDCVWSKDVAVTDGVLGSEVQSFRGFLKLNSHLYRMAANVYHRSADGRGDDLSPLQRDLYLPARWEASPLREAARSYRTEVEAIARACRERSIPLLACIIPTEFSVSALESRTVPAGGLVPELPERIVSGILGDLGTPHWSAGPGLAELTSARSYFAFDNHLTPEGHAVVAGGILGHPAVKELLERFARR